MGNITNKSRASQPEAAQLVETAISTYPVVIFSKSYCPYCKSAKRDIAQAGNSVDGFTPPKVYEIERMGKLGSQIQSYLAEKTGRRTVPNVFIGGKAVGGGDEIGGYSRNGVLKQMLAQASVRMNDTRKQEVTKLVEETIMNPVVIFSKSYCPYCKRAKSLLAQAGNSVEGYNEAVVLELDQRPDGELIQQILKEKTGQSTVPSIFIAGNHVGGSDDLGAIAERNELVSMISQAVSPHADDSESKADTEVAGASVSAVADTVSPMELVEDAIANNPIVVFSKSYCPYCIRAKALLAKTGNTIPDYRQPKAFEIDEMEAGSEIQRYLLEKTGQSTVPNIFIGGQHIGGSDSLSSVAQRGELVSLIKDAQKIIPVADAVVAEQETPTAPATKEIVFGAGCFWGVQLAFQRVVGVVKSEVGYSNGKVPRVTYDAICSGLTGSVEVVRVTYDSSIVSLTDLLKVWEGRHDPTSLNKQGNDIGTQYRSAVYYNDQEQAAEIAKYSQEAATRLSNPIVTEISPVKNYCTAEEYHQGYLAKKGQSAEKGATENIRCYG